MTPNTTKQAPINSLVLIPVQDTNEPIGQQAKHIAATDLSGTSVGGIITTIAEFRASDDIPTNVPVFTKDYGTGTWYYIGLDDGQYVDDTANTVITANSHVWRRFKDGIVSVTMFGADPTASAFSTDAIQSALDYGVGSVYFPPGEYKVHSDDEYCLLLSKNVNLLSDKSRSCIIRADFCAANTSILKVEITDNNGLLDCRDLRFENITFFHNGGGKHAVEIDGGMSLSNFWIINCSAYEGTTPSGNGLYCTNMSFGGIREGVYSSIFLDGVADGIRVQAATFLGTKTGLTINIVQGSYSHDISNNVFTNRDGALRVINGSQIKFYNNQIEHAQYHNSRNLGLTCSHIWLEGQDYPCTNNLFWANNFGGGTNVDYLMYFSNTNGNVVDMGFFNAPDKEDLYFTPSSINNRIYPNNFYQGNISDPRPNGLEVADFGTNNYHPQGGRFLSTGEISNFNNLGKFGFNEPQASEVVEVGSRGDNLNYIRLNGITSSSNAVLAGIKSFNNNSSGFEIGRIDFGVGSNVSDGFISIKTSNSGSLVEAIRVLENSDTKTLDLLARQISIGTNTKVGGLIINTGSSRAVAIRPASDFGAFDGNILESVDDPITGYKNLWIEGEIITFCQFSLGKVIIGAVGAGNFKFDVGGDARVSGQMNSTSSQTTFSSYTTTSEPDAPAAGTVVEWWNGTNKKWKKPDGTTGTIY